MIKQKKIFKLGELFSGPGGIGLGALNAKLEDNDNIYHFEHSWASDYNEDSCETYRFNILPDHPEKVLCKDVRNLNIEQLENIDGFSYGFPCNDFSIVGEKRGINGIYGPLYTYGVKVLNIFKPSFFIAENVGGLTSANNGAALKTILNDLKNAGNGYEVTAHLYKFENYGIPQMRHRIIIVGFDKSLNIKFKVPSPFTLNNPVTVHEAIESPPIPINASNQEKTMQSKTVIERLQYIKPGENAWTAELPDHLKLNVVKAKMSQIYRRMHQDRPAYTITGSGGGGTHGYHWKKPRALTNRERARIQTFPDNFVFKGSKESVRKQIGMAVPPKMSQLIFECILKSFAGVGYEYIEENINTQTTDIINEQLQLALV